MTEENVLKGPLDPQYTGHRDADRRREETRA
jgi:hypothetical protein